MTRSVSLALNDCSPGLGRGKRDTGARRPTKIDHTREPNVGAPARLCDNSIGLSSTLLMLPDPFST